MRLLVGKWKMGWHGEERRMDCAAASPGPQNEEDEKLERAANW